MLKHLYSVAFLLFFIATTPLTAQSESAVVQTGIEVLADLNFEPLSGKRVGLITNATGVNRGLKSTIDLFFESDKVELIALYGPEHGVRGDIPAGEKVATYTDEQTGVKVFSLYGSTRKPTQEMLEGVEVLVYDIQDIGVRSYTFISTMGLAMEAASEAGIPFMVLDRPNPLGGNRVEGNIVEDGFFSFVSQFPIPYVYGLTAGELAQLINAEGMLKNSVEADLTVIPMKGWNRDLNFDQTGLPWVPTSPHIPHSLSPFYYVASGVLGELGVLSEGVGYTTPFQVYGAEWIDEALLAERFNDLNLEGVLFRPLIYKPYYGRDQGKTLHGVQIHITDYNAVNLMELQFVFMQIHHELYPDKNPFKMANDNRLPFFDKVVGSSNIRTMFSTDFDIASIRDYLNKDVKAFTELSKQYHLYK